MTIVKSALKLNNENNWMKCVINCAAVWFAIVDNGNIYAPLITFSHELETDAVGINQQKWFSWRVHLICGKGKSGECAVRTQKISSGEDPFLKSANSFLHRIRKQRRAHLFSARFAVLLFRQHEFTLFRNESTLFSFCVFDVTDSHRYGKIGRVKGKEKHGASLIMITVSHIHKNYRQLDLKPEVSTQYHGHLQQPITCSNNNSQHQTFANINWMHGGREVYNSVRVQLYMPVYMQVFYCMCLVYLCM